MKKTINKVLALRIGMVLYVPIVTLFIIWILRDKMHTDHTMIAYGYLAFFILSIPYALYNDGTKKITLKTLEILNIRDKEYLTYYSVVYMVFVTLMTIAGLFLNTIW